MAREYGRVSFQVVVPNCTLCVQMREVQAGRESPHQLHRDVAILCSRRTQQILSPGCLSVRKRPTCSIRH